MKLTAAVNLALALVLALSSCAPTPVESKQGASPEVEAVRSRRHVVQKRLTAEDVLGDLHTQESATINENISASHCLGNPMIRGSCKELYDDGLKTSGFYLINPGGAPEFTVFCDMNTNVVNRPGNGWTVILRRLDSSLPSFNRSWEEYRNGFGCLNDSFWLGLERIRYVVSHNLPGCSNTTHQLYVGMEQYHLFNPTMPYNWAVYNFFSIGDESDNYELNIDNVGGGSSYDTLSKAGDALKIHSGVEFSTYDHDNDISTGHCAETGGGGWWYRNCLDSHLTGMFYDQGYMPPPAYDGIIWEGTTSDHDSLIRAVMAVRPVCND